MMKKIVAIFAALVIAVLCALPCMAARQPSSVIGTAAVLTTEAATAPAADDAALEKNAEENDGINIPVVTALIIGICGVLTLSILVVDVLLARKNRGK